jgi:hypothetical protein
MTLITIDSDSSHARWQKTVHDRQTTASRSVQSGFRSMAVGAARRLEVGDSPRPASAAGRFWPPPAELLSLVPT